MKKFLSVLSILVLSGQLAFAQVTTGEAAKDFSVKDVNGQEQSLSQYKGKYIVLEWFNHDCPFVKKHYHSNNMQSLQKEFIEKGVIWIAINSSAAGKEGHYSAEETKKMMEQKGASPTAVVLDPDGTIGHMYGAQTTPHMYIINPEGVLIYQGAIDDKKSTDEADIALAKNYVRAALNEAMSGQAVTDSTTKSYGCSIKY